MQTGRNFQSIWLFVTEVKYLRRSTSKFYFLVSVNRRYFRFQFNAWICLFWTILFYISNLVVLVHWLRTILNSTFHNCGILIYHSLNFPLKNLDADHEMFEMCVRCHTDYLYCKMVPWQFFWPLSSHYSLKFKLVDPKWWTT